MKESDKILRNRKTPNYSVILNEERPPLYVRKLA